MVYWSERATLRQMLREIPAADAVFANTGHIDIEMLEDNPALCGIVCPKRALEGMDLASVSALGVAAFKMPDSSEYSGEWEMILEGLGRLFDGKRSSLVLNQEVYHHPNWRRVSGAEGSTVHCKEQKIY